MKLLIDECVDEKLRHQLPGHQCQTVRFAGFSGLKNGRLLNAAEAAGFEVLITVDQSIADQQNLTERKISLLIFCASTNRLEDIEPLIPAALRTLANMGRGQVVTIKAGLA